MTKKIKLNVFSTLKKLEALQGRNYSIAEVVEKTKLHRNTVRGLLRGTTKRIDLDSLTAFFLFFLNEGLEIKVNDLLIISEDEA